MNQKRKGFSIGKLFNNDRFVLIFSVFAAIILWFIMATVNTEERPRVIYDVPILVELSEEAKAAGYQVFEQSDLTAKVSVTGNSLVVNQLSKNDLKVQVQNFQQITPGQMTLNLVAVKQNQQADYEISSVDPGSVIVNVDRYKEITLDVANEIKYTVDDRHFVNSPVLSLHTVTLSGPETQLAKVAKVSAEYTVRDPLTETMKFTTRLILRDAEGNEIPNTNELIQFANGSDDVEVTIPVLSRASVPLEVTYSNQPEQLDLSAIMRMDHQRIEVGASQQELENLHSISLRPIDFSNISPTRNSVVLHVELPENFTNLSNIDMVNVSFDLDDFTVKTLQVEQFLTKSRLANQNVEITTQSLPVTIVAPKSVMEKITSEDLYAEVNLAGQEHFTGSTELPVKIFVKNPDYTAWAYGNYKANVTITQASE